LAGWRQRDGEDGVRRAGVALGDGDRVQVDVEGRLAVVVDDVAGAHALRHGAVARPAEADQEGLVRLEARVADDLDGDGGARRAGGDGQRVVDRQVVEVGPGRLVDGLVRDADVLRRRVGEVDGEVERRGEVRVVALVPGDGRGDGDGRAVVV